MKNLFLSSIIIIILAIFASCGKDQGLLPFLEFSKTGDNIYKDTLLDKGSSFTISLKSYKAEDADVLKKFNINKIVNASAGVSVFSKDLTSTEADTFKYSFTSKLDTIAGQKNKFVFTITNRDGLVKQDSLTITTK